MSPEQDPPSQADLERRRVPLERKVSLKFKEFRGFITEVSHNVSLGGMFIATASPKPPGTIFDFELSLTDDFKLVQGIGEVVWIRESDEGAGRPPGMGVRFLDLSPESRRLVQRIVEEHVGHGGVPFDLEPAPFPPPPLRTAPQPPPSPPPALFHPTAAPMAAPPGPGRRSADLGTASAPGAPPEPAEVTPDSRTARLPRIRPLPPVLPAALDEPAAGLPDLEPPELPIPELPGVAPDGFGPPAGPAAPGASAGATRPTASSAPAHDELLPAVEAAWSAPLASPMDQAPARPSPRVADGLAEVVRALGTPAPDRAREMDDTVRLARFAPPQAPATAATASGESAPSIALGTGHLAPPPATPQRRRADRRRSRWPLGAALVALLVAGGAVAALYLRYPALLPAWAPGAPPPPAAEDRPHRVHPRRATAEELEARARRDGAAPAAAGGDGLASQPATGELGPAAAPPAAAEPAADAPPASTARFSTLEEIWGQRNAAGTLVTLVADGIVPRDSFTTAHLDGGKPREVLYLRGVAAKFARSAVPVETPEVTQVRTGYHLKPAGNELHVVVDLAAADVRLLRAVAVDNRIELQFGR